MWLLEMAETDFALGIEASKLLPCSVLIYSLYHLPVKLSSERPASLHPSEPPDPPDPPDPSPSLFINPITQLALLLLACICSKGPMNRRGSRGVALSSLPQGHVSPDRKISPTTVMFSSPTLMFPQVVSASSVAAPSLEWYWFSESYVDLVLWNVVLARLVLIVSMICVPSSGFSTAQVRIFTAICRFNQEYHGDEVYLVDSTKSNRQPRTTCVHVSILTDWPCLLVSPRCALSIGLVGIEEYNDNIGCVSILSCIEVCFTQALVIHYAKGIVPLTSYGAYYLVVARFTFLSQSSLACRYVFPLVVISMAIRKFIFSPKVPLVVSGLVAQDSSVLQGFSSRQCLSFAFGAASVAFVVVDDLVPSCLRRNSIWSS